MIRVGSRVQGSLTKRNGTVQSIADGCARVHFDNGDKNTVEMKRLLELTTMLDWDAPVYATDGRRFIFNAQGYGRANSLASEGLGNVNRECWYGWLGEAYADGGWWYEDGTPCPCNTHLPALSNKEPTIMLDPKRAVQTTETPPRFARTIGILERTEGVITLLLDVPLLGSRGASSELEVTLEGKTIGIQGSALTFINVPVVTSAFYPLEKTGQPVNARGMISLDMAKSEYPPANFFLEVVRTDGVPTEAKLHVR